MIRRIARTEVLYHLLIPLALGFVGEAAFAYAFGIATDWATLRRYLISVERGGFVLGALLAYSVIMYLVIRRTTNVGMRRLGLAVLEDALKDATSYFALGTVRLKEWFDPSMQAYLATINKHAASCANFRHDRVLLFFSKSDIKDLGSDYLDGYYAKSLIELHKQYGIHLGFLERNEIFALLDELSIDEKSDLKCNRWPNTLIAKIASDRAGPVKWLSGVASKNRGFKHLLSWIALLVMKPVAWLSRAYVKKVPLSWWRRRIRKLAFGFIEYGQGRSGVLVFHKRGQIITIDRVEDSEPAMQSYVKFVLLIRSEVYKNTPAWPDSVIRPQHDFTNYY